MFKPLINNTKDKKIDNISSSPASPFPTSPSFSTSSISNSSQSNAQQEEILIDGPLPGFEDEEEDVSVPAVETDKKVPVIVGGTRPPLNPPPAINTIINLEEFTDFCVFYTEKLGDNFSTVVRAKFKSEYAPDDAHTIIHRTFQKYTKSEMTDMLFYIAHLLVSKSLVYKHSLDNIPLNASFAEGKLLLEQDYSLPKSHTKS